MSHPDGNVEQAFGYQKAPWEIGLLDSPLARKIIAEREEQNDWLRDVSNENVAEFVGCYVERHRKGLSLTVGGVTKFFDSNSDFIYHRANALSRWLEGKHAEVLSMDQRYRAPALLLEIITRDVLSLWLSSDGDIDVLMLPTSLDRSGPKRSKEGQDRVNRGADLVIIEYDGPQKVPVLLLDVTAKEGNDNGGAIKKKPGYNDDLELPVSVLACGGLTVESEETELKVFDYLRLARRSIVGGDYRLQERESVPLLAQLSPYIKEQLVRACALSGIVLDHPRYPSAASRHLENLALRFGAIGL